MAVTVITYFNTEAIHQGLSAIPAIAGQIAQIFMGAALAKGLAVLVEKEQQD